MRDVFMMLAYAWIIMMIIFMAICGFIALTGVWARHESEAADLKHSRAKHHIGNIQNRSAHYARKRTRSKL